MDDEDDQVQHRNRHWRGVQAAQNSLPSASTITTIAGYADITVPGGYDGVLPLGLTFIGGRRAEPELIGLGCAFEQATHVRVPPAKLTSSGGRD